MKSLSKIAREVTELNLKDASIPGVSSMEILARRLHIVGAHELKELSSILSNLFMASVMLQKNNVDVKSIFLSAMVTAMSVGAAVATRLEDDTEGSQSIN